jgi:hypothetical protein
MILKRYGNQLHSVRPNFDARAMNEIGFQRDHEFSIPADEFAEKFTRIDEKHFTGQGAGMVQQDAEEAALAQLRADLDACTGGLASGCVVVVESEQGQNYPKMREKVTNLVIEGENKLHFERTIDPPLRIGIYEPRKS